MNSEPDNTATAEPQRDLTTFIQIAALVLLLGASLMVIGPFLHTVIWGVILSVAIYPLFARLANTLGGRQSWSATLITLLGLTVLLLPGWLIVDSTIESANVLAQSTRDGSLAIPQPDEAVAEWPLIGKPLYASWQEAATNLSGFVEDNREQVIAAAQWLAGAVSGLVFGLLAFAASFVIAGFLMMYAAPGRNFLITVANRIVPGHGETLTDLCTATIRSVTNGVLGVAVIQAVLAGIGFAVMDVPAGGILTILVLIGAIIQLPTVIIILPVIIWVFSYAAAVPATIFAVYGLLVALSDNVLKPLLLARGVDLPILVVLLGAIGGMVSFGVIGLFMGAVILGIAYQIISVWAGLAQNETDSATDQA